MWKCFVKHLKKKKKQIFSSFWTIFYVSCSFFCTLRSSSWIIPKQVWVVSFPLTHKKTEALGSYRPRPECLPTRTAVGQGTSVWRRAFLHTWPVELPFNQHQLCALYCSRHFTYNLSSFITWLTWQSICLPRGRLEFDPWVGKIPWRRAWQPTPVFLPRESHEQRSLVGYSPMGSQKVRHS